MPPMPLLHLTAIFLTFVLHPSCIRSAFAEPDGIYGNVTALSQASAHATSVSAIRQPYPQQYGTRTTSPVSDIALPIHCSSCDRGAPTEYCYHDDGFCIKLSDTSVYGIHSQDGSLQADTRSLAAGCTPRYLQSIQTTELVVVCHESCFQLISRSGSTLTLHDRTCGERRGGIVVEVFTLYGLNLFQVELDGNHVISTDHSFPGYPMDITPMDCTEPLFLRPIFTRDKFFLRCRTNDGDKVYVLHPYESGAESLFLDGVPLSSPDGRTFATASNTTLKVYNTDNLEQYPGAKDFGVAITFCTYLNSDFLIVLLEGRNQVLVRVFTFLNSAGGDGLTVLPHTSSSSPIHKLIAPDVYATSNQTGSVYSIQLFNISSGQPLKPVSNLIKEPLDVFFFRGTGLPPPVLQPLSPLALDTTPSPSSTSLPTPSTDELSSRLPSETAMAKPPVESTQPKTDESTDDKPTSPNGTSVVQSHQHYIVVAVVVVAVILAAVVFLALFVLWKFKRHVKQRGPYKQETKKGQSESGIKIPPIPVQPSPSSSGTTTPSTNNSSYQDIPGQLVPGTFSPH